MLTHVANFSDHLTPSSLAWVAKLLNKRYPSKASNTFENLLNKQ